MQPYYMARLGARTEPSLLAYSENKHLRRELSQFKDYIWVDIAHCVMLAERGIIGRDDAGRIVSALLEILASDFSESITDAGTGSLLLQVEAELGRRVGGDAAGLLHTARSRLDQGPTARRMVKRRRVLDTIEAMVGCSERLGQLARTHTESLMPGFTCLQHAHPTTLGHYLTAMQDRILEQAEKLEQGFDRINLCPLGGVGLSGTTWPIDRMRVAELLGFSAPVRHARRSRDALYTAEIVASLSLVMSVLYDLATDLAIWSSTEFGFVELDAGFCSTSSIFPNKKNPTALDAIRSEAGQATQWFSGLLAKFRGHGASDVVLQEAEVLDGAFDLVCATLGIMSEIVATLQVNEIAMRTTASGSWTTASCLADWLFRTQALPYRKGYSLVASVVRYAATHGIAKKDLDASRVNAIAAELGLGVTIAQDDLDTALDAGAFVAAAHSMGGCSPSEISRLLETYREEENAHRAFVAEGRRNDAAAWSLTLTAASRLADQS